MVVYYIDNHKGNYVFIKFTKKSEIPKNGSSWGFLYGLLVRIMSV